MLYKSQLLLAFLPVPADLKNGFVWLREGGMNKRKVSEDPDSKTWWSVAPTPLVAGKTATLLYNSKAGPLAWIEDKRPKGKTVSTSELLSKVFFVSSGVAAAAVD
jgi:hypothetical protein